MVEKESQPAEQAQLLNSVALTDDEEFLDRLWSFGEGYFDLSILDEILGNNGENSSDRA
jgi:hypothetical protein